MLSRVTYALLILVILMARASHAWTLTADPCCHGNGEIQHGSLTTHVVPDDMGGESATDHALHAGHCHCLWEMPAVVMIAVPPAAPPVWHTSPPNLPTVEPRGIEWPPKPRA